MIDKNLVLIEYLKQNKDALGLTDFKIKSEYSLDDKDIEVLIVQMQDGQKQVLFDNTKLYDYFMIQVFGQSIREEKAIAVALNDLIGNNVIVEYNGQKYQILFMQFSNAQTIMYEDIQRVGYTLTLRTVLNEI